MLLVYSCPNLDFYYEWLVSSLMDPVNEVAGLIFFWAYAVYPSISLRLKANFLCVEHEISLLYFWAFPSHGM